MKWIKCEDRSPPKDGTISIGYDKWANIFLFYYGMGTWHEFHINGEIAYEIESTHWMPLPNSPE